MNRVERDLGGEAPQDRVHPAPAGNRLRRDGSGHQGGRTDRRILLSEKGEIRRNPLHPLKSVEIRCIR